MSEIHSSSSRSADAARWRVCRDRGFSPTEAADFQAWLATDPANAVAFTAASKLWTLMDELPADFAVSMSKLEPESVQERHRAWWRNAGKLGGLAAAAAIVFAVLWAVPGTAEKNAPPRVATLETVMPQMLALPDGTVVRLNAGAEVEPHYTASERRVILRHGEAHFAVTKNPARPFIVRVGEVEVRAVGTAFDVHLQAESIDVLVTEGKVRLDGKLAGGKKETVSGPHDKSAEETPLVTAGQRATISVPSDAAAQVVVTNVSDSDMAQLLKWQEPLLRLRGATLAELAVEFQRRTGHRLVLADEELANLQIGGRFRAADIDGFVRLLVANYGIVIDHEDENETVLRKAR